MLNEDLRDKLSMFDGLHLGTLGFFVVIISLLFIFRKKINNERFEKTFRILMGLFLLIFETSYHIWVLSRRSYSIDMIPLTGFCAMTNLLTIYALLSNKTKLFNYIIYYALTGALLSLVFIDLTYAIPHFRYFHYFFVHFGFLLSSLYYYATGHLEFNNKNLLKGSLCVFVYSLVVLVFDIILDKNWFYLIENPLKEISDSLGAPWYTILWIITIMVVTYLWYLLLKAFQKNKTN